MHLGNMPKDGGNLIMSRDAAENLVNEHNVSRKYLRKFFGSHELIHSQPRACLWIDDSELNEAKQNQAISSILDRVARFRSSSPAASTRQHAKTPHRFVQMPAAAGERTIVIPRVSSHSRRYLPVDYLESGPVIGDKCYAMYDAALWNFALVASSMHIVWIDDRLIAVDEFHHVSVSDDNRLGEFVRQLIERDKTHLIAMTGSYFRGDAAAVLMPEDERRFVTVTYTYYEQLSGYKHLKQLDIGYYFYSGSYLDDLQKVLDENEKTIIHIPNVNSRESTQDKHKEVEHILETLGEWLGTDDATGFQLVKTSTGRTLRIADLVDDEPIKREKVAAALRDPVGRENRDHVDIIIALGMAKEGFDWIWCEHALTIGYRSSLTEIVQIIGRATRDAVGKTRARFTNLIAEPDAGEQAVTEAVNDTLKAIAASLLMEQVLAPRFEFRPKTPANVPNGPNVPSGPQPGLDYGTDGYDHGGCNVGVDPATGGVQIEINGLIEPESDEATRICREDLNEVLASFVQDTRTVQDGLFNDELPPQETTQQRMGKIIRDKYPDLSEQDQEAIRQRAVAALNLIQMGGKKASGSGATSNTALIDGIRRYVTDVRDLNVDLIDSINPFGEAYNILAKTMNEERLRQVQSAIAGRRVQLTPEEARDLAKRALKFKNERGRLPSITSQDAWERRMAEGIAFLARMKQEKTSG